MFDQITIQPQLKSNTYKYFINFRNFDKTVFYIYFNEKSLDFLFFRKIYSRLGTAPRILLYRNFRVRGKVVIEKIKNYFHLRRWNVIPLVNYKAVSKQRIFFRILNAVIPLFKNIPPINRNFSRWLKLYEFSPERKTGLIIVKQKDQPLDPELFRLLLHLTYAARIQKPELFYLPDYILFASYEGKGVFRYYIVRVPEDSYRRTLILLRKLINGLIKNNLIKEKLDEISKDILKEDIKEEIEEEKPVILSGKKIEVEKEAINVEPSEKAKKSLSVFLQRKEKEDIKKIYVEKLKGVDSNKIKKTVEKEILKLNIRTPDRKTFTPEEERVEVILSSAINTDTELNRHVYNLKNNTFVKPFHEPLLDNYTNNGIVNRVLDHTRESCAKSHELLISLVEDALKKYGLNNFQIKIEKDEYKSVNQNINTRAKIVKVEFDDSGFKGSFEFFLPELDENNLIFFAGNFYNVLGQLYPLPVQNVKPGIFRLHTLNGVLTLERKNHFVKCRLLGMNLTPTLLWVIMQNPEDENTTAVFENLMQRFNIKYEIEEKPIRKGVSIKLGTKKYINFVNLDEYQSFIINSILGVTKVAKLSDTLEKLAIPLSYKWFGALLEVLNNRPNALYYLRLKLKTFFDPITKNMLKIQGYPVDESELLLYLQEILYNNPNIKFSSKRDITNYRLRTCEQIVHLNYQLFIDEIQKYLRNRDLFGAKVPVKLDKRISIMALLSGFKGSRLIESANPLEEIVNYSKVDLRGYSGLTEDAATLEDRSIGEKHKTIIDPVDTPESQNIGLTNVLANGVVIENIYGVLSQSPYKDSPKGRVFGPTLSLVPFSNRNETTRLMMSAAQLKQVIPTKRMELPAVLTGYEFLIPGMASKKHSLMSSCRGEVTNIKDEREKTIITIKCEKGPQIDYEVPKYSEGRSGQGHHSFIEYNIRVQKGQKVEKGEIIANSQWFDENTLGYRFGNNVLAVLGEFDGLTYEDGIVVSEELSDELTSLHLDVYKAFLEPQDKIVYFFPEKIGQELKPGDVLITVDSENIEYYLEGGIFQDTEIVLTTTGYKVINKVKGKIKFIKIYITPAYLNSILGSLANKLSPFIVQSEHVFWFKNKPVSGCYIEIGIEYEMKPQIGDKLVTRHANKGVISAILPAKDMPIIKTLDNRRAQVIFNGAAVVDRAITGLIYEMYTTNILYRMAEAVLNTDFKNKKEVDNLFSILERLKIFGKANESIVRNFFADENFRKKIIQIIKETLLFPVIILPFEDVKPSDIMKLMHHFSIPERHTILYKNKELKAVSGFVYLCKLEHMSFFKLKARSIGNYNPKTGEPVTGQKIGEFDIYQLLAWDAYNIIRELYSENMIERTLLYKSIISKGYVNIDEIKNITISYDVKQASKFADVFFKGLLINLV